MVSGGKGGFPHTYHYGNRSSHRDKQSFNCKLNLGKLRCSKHVYPVSHDLPDVRFFNSPV